MYMYICIGDFAYIHVLQISIYIYIYLVYTHVHICIIYTGLFCDGMRQYGVPGNENEECIFCMLVLQYHIINHGVLAPSPDVFERNSKNV